MKTNIKKNATAKRIIIGGVSGIAIGASTMATAGNAILEDSPVEEEQASDNNLDDLSFGEAFNAARQDLGPNGTFEWHGQLYSTSTAEEWEAAHPSEPLSEEDEPIQDADMEEVETEEEVDSENDEVEILGTEDEQDDEIEAEVETGNDINGDDAAFVEIEEPIQTDAVEDVFVGQDADSVCDVHDDFVNDDAPVI